MLSWPPVALKRGRWLSWQRYFKTKAEVPKFSINFRTIAGHYKFSKRRKSLQSLFLMRCFCLAPIDSSICDVSCNFSFPAFNINKTKLDPRRSKQISNAASKTRLYRHMSSDFIISMWNIAKDRSIMLGSQGRSTIYRLVETRKHRARIHNNTFNSTDWLHNH